MAEAATPPHAAVFVSLYVKVPVGFVQVMTLSLKPSDVRGDLTKISFCWQWSPKDFSSSGPASRETCKALFSVERQVSRSPDASRLVHNIKVKVKTTSANFIPRRYISVYKKLKN